uniref:Uncharacterized protein n=1 Tax=viral metagenome TaxID=1070528 RepID=A0A6C0BMI2_9ZZZZ
MVDNDDDVTPWWLDSEEDDEPVSPPAPKSPRPSPPSSPRPRPQQFLTSKLPVQPSSPQKSMIATSDAIITGLVGYAFMGAFLAYKTSNYRQALKLCQDACDAKQEDDD